LVSECPSDSPVHLRSTDHARRLQVRPTARPLHLTLVQSLLWTDRFSACRFPGRPNTRPSGETTGRWTSIGTGDWLAFKLNRLWPAGRRVLPRLLPPVDCQVEQPVAVIHRLDAASRRPVRLEEPWILAAGSKRCASCPPVVQPRGCRASPGPSTKASPSP